jgi:hypothetical protein
MAVSVKRFVNILLCLAVVLSFCRAAPAAAGHEAGIRFDVGVPRGDFADNAEDPGFGLAGHYAYAVNPVFSFGIGGNFLIYGSESRTEALPLVEDFEVTTDNNIAGLFLLAQCNLVPGPVTPYVEGRFGGHYLWTDSKLEDTDWIDADEVATTVNFDDFALLYGLGGGLRIGLGKGDLGEPTVHLDLKAMMMRGGEAEYLTEGDIDIVYDRPVFRPSLTRTDLLHFELGLIFGF